MEKTWDVMMFFYFIENTFELAPQCLDIYLIEVDCQWKLNNIFNATSRSHYILVSKPPPTVWFAYRTVFRLLKKQSLHNIPYV